MRRRPPRCKLFHYTTLFRSNEEGAMLMHFYHPETEEMLAKTETSYRNKKATEIRRTYFSVRKDGSGYKFVVTSQSLLR